MKYDLEAMNFVPDCDHLDGAFVWDETPEGHKYWKEQFYNGPDSEALRRWNEMEAQWKEEN